MFSPESLIKVTWSRKKFAAPENSAPENMFIRFFFKRLDMMTKWVELQFFVLTRIFVFSRRFFGRILVKLAGREPRELNHSILHVLVYPTPQYVALSTGGPLADQR